MNKANRSIHKRVIKKFRIWHYLLGKNDDEIRIYLYREIINQVRDQVRLPGGR